MIPEVDHALRTLIEREAIDPTQVDVKFEMPTRDWISRRSAPTVGVYLYDIHEDRRHQYVKLSYLVAVWSDHDEDESRLLAALLGCFLRFDVLAADVLTGSVAALDLPVTLTVALPPPEDPALVSVWTALGSQVKPSLDVVVTTATDSGR